MSYIIGPSTRMLFAQVRDAREPITMPVIDRRVLTGLPMYGRRVLRGNTATREPREVSKPSLVIAATHTGVRRHRFSLTGSAAPFTPDGWAWDFGDGTTGSGATPEHTYAAPGNYDVSVVVTDGFSFAGRYLAVDFPVDNTVPSVEDSYYPASSGTAATSGSMFTVSGEKAVWADALDDARGLLTNTVSVLDNQSITAMMTARHDTLAPTHPFYFSNLRRGFLRFDTSALADTPISAKVQLTVPSFADWGDHFPIQGSPEYAPDQDIAGGTFRLVLWGRVDNAADVAADPETDWQSLTDAAYASDTVFNLEDVVNLQTVEFVLNAAGLAAIEQGGVTCFAIELSYDRDNLVPTDVTSMVSPYAVTTYIAFYNMDAAIWGADFVPPVLKVTH